MAIDTSRKAKVTAVYVHAHVCVNVCVCLMVVYFSCFDSSYHVWLPDAGHVLVIMCQVSMVCPLQNFPATIWLISSSHSGFSLSAMLPCAMGSLHLPGTLGPSPSFPFPPIPILGRSAVTGSCVRYSLCSLSLALFLALTLV